MKRSTPSRPARLARPAKKRASEGARPDGLDGLAVYRKKRDFDITPEPAPETRRAKNGRPGALEFVVQKHDATRLHYDVRIEVAGAMMSWAVPKGPSFDPSVKRLAVETEDHPMAYNRFEGRIPDGEYGGGDVFIWDRGTYETVPPKQEQAMRAKGHIVARFSGEKLQGDWHFVRTNRGGSSSHSSARGGGAESAKTQWLMFKAKDAHADAALDIVATRPESVVSGKSATRGPRRVGASPAGRSVVALLETVGEPMRATLAAEIGDPTAYVYEIKHDGYRLLAARAGDETRLVTRKGNDWTTRFEALAKATAALPVREAVLDGEACIVDAKGRSDFQRLQSWLGGDAKAGTFVFAAFDLLWLDGRDLRAQPLEERRELLAALLAKAKAPFALSPLLEGKLAANEKTARAGGAEGLVAKRKGSRYVSGGTGDWWKLKFRKQQEVALAGYIPMTGTTDEVGALLIAVATKDGGFELAGKVGTGFTRQTRKELARLLDADHRPKATVTHHRTLKGARWSAVKHVAEIALSEWTRDGSARAPSFIALREDKSPADCVREVEVRETSRARGRKASRQPVPASPPATSVKLTNSDKVLYPKDGITKQDIAAYYASVSSVMLPHLAGRPIGLQRWPNGIAEEAWFQQNAPPKVPDFVRIIDTGPHHGSSRKLIVENPETLVWLANLAALTVHQWATHVPEAAHTQAAITRALGQADYAVIDLDPGNGPWSDVIEVAAAVRHLLEAMSLVSAVKTSGQRGLHVVIPFGGGATHHDVTEFARKVATAVADALPKIATVERMKAKRGGRLYVDFLQNGEGKTVVSPYTLRAKDGAPVSTPVSWSEVTKKLDPSRFTLRTVRARLEKHGDLFAPVLTTEQAIPKVV
jgi:bifunctional non-homologous end joining protein LigD